MMKAKEIIDKYVVENMKKYVGVIAISQKDGHWFHVHLEEDIPETGYDITIHVRD